ncbi:hypothetical protein [Gemmiger sp.]
MIKIKEKLKGNAAGKIPKAAPKKARTPNRRNLDGRITRQTGGNFQYGTT